VFAAFAALLHGVLLLWRRWDAADLPAYRRPWLAALTPLAVLALVLVLSGGQRFLGESRFNTTDPSDMTSGRIATWTQVARDWQHAPLAEKIFGDATTSRGVVTRVNDGAQAGADRMKLNTDNAAVGAFRRGGVLGALAFLLGLVLLLWHGILRRGPGGDVLGRDVLGLSVLGRGVLGRSPLGGGGVLPAAWFTIAAVGVLPTIATEDWLLGGTNGAIWILLVAGEAFLLRSPASAGQPDREPDAAKAPPAPPVQSLDPLHQPS
jgi:hypothetical protein